MNVVSGTGWFDDFATSSALTLLQQQRRDHQTHFYVTA